MTVINMISFGEDGVAIADEQSSTEFRKYNIAQKLQLLNQSIVYGGSGPADFIKEVYNNIYHEIESVKKTKDKISLKEVFLISQNSLANHKNNFKNQVLSANLGISLDDLLTGILSRNGRKLDESVMQAGRNILRDVDEKGGISLILGGLEDKKFGIYILDTSYGGRLISRPYCSIGSGSDESEKVLSRYIASLPRDGRESINKHEGVVKIIEATNASSNLNIGVGGSPSIVYVSEEQILRPNEQQCVLASELVEGLTNNLLERDFVYDSVSRLIFDDGKFDDIEEEMKQRAKDWKNLDRLLRGYKIKS